MLKSLKVPTTDLELGMYVSALDRPWLGTPFITQGFVIEDREQIDRLREYCNYVVVDTRRSHKLSAVPLRKARNNLPKVEKEHRAMERPRVSVEKIFEGRKIKAYHDGSNWEEEHPRARAALDTLVDDINGIFEEVIDGGKIEPVEMTT